MQNEHPAPPIRWTTATIVLAVVITLFFAALTYQQAYPEREPALQSTIQQHSGFAERLQAGQELRRGLNSLPHPGYFYLLIALNRAGLSLELAATLVLLTAHLAAVYVIYRIYRHFLGESLPESTILLFTFLVLIVGAIYVPFFNPSPYFGQGSPNVHHNSTVILAKPIATLVFFLGIALMEQNDTGKRTRLLVITALLLALSVVIKPTFAIVFLPALGLYLLIERTQLVKRLWTLALIVLPTILLLLIQMASYYQTPVSGEEAPRGLQLVFLDVWHTQTHSVPISILLAIAFPLAVTIFRYKSLIARPYLIVAWLMTLIGAVQFAFIGETQDGEVLRSANWIGGYLMGLSALFTVAVLEFLGWLRERREARQAGAAQPGTAFWATSVIFGLHLVSGLFYDTILLVWGKLPPPLEPLSTLF
jgi:hypothetical protein